MLGTNERYAKLDEYNWLMGEILRHETEQAMALGVLLNRHLNPSRVLDVGCGPGIYLAPFKDAGKMVLGIDGAPGAGEYLAHGEFQLVDFRSQKPELLGFDLVMCIEVAEHVPEEYSDNLMDIIVDACVLGGSIFFCAARPGQGGEGHYNEKPKEYWMKKFRERNCVIHPLSSVINDSIQAGQEYEHCHWLQWNSFMVQKRAE